MECPKRGHDVENILRNKMEQIVPISFYSSDKILGQKQLREEKDLFDSQFQVSAIIKEVRTGT